MSTTSETNKAMRVPDDRQRAYGELPPSEYEARLQYGKLLDAELEIERLTKALHAKQAHPDFSYCVTLAGNETAHHDVSEWELNEAIGNGGCVPATSYHQTASLYWRKRNV